MLNSLRNAKYVYNIKYLVILEYFSIIFKFIACIKQFFLVHLVGIVHFKKISLSNLLIYCTLNLTPI